MELDEASDFAEKAYDRDIGQALADVKVGNVPDIVMPSSGGAGGIEEGQYNDEIEDIDSDDEYALASH